MSSTQQMMIQQQHQPPQPLQSMQPSHMDCVDAINDVHEKIKMKQEREIHAQQTQPQGNLNHEIRDPHGILHILKSMRSRL